MLIHGKGGEGPRDETKPIKAETQPYRLIIKQQRNRAMAKKAKKKKMKK